MLGTRRREVITLLAGAAATWPLGARAQQRTLPMVGVLGSGSREAIEFPSSAFLQGLGDAGYVVGRDVAMSTVGATASKICCGRWQQTWCSAGPRRS
jgi:hypothetical protein